MELDEYEQKRDFRRTPEPNPDQSGDDGNDEGDGDAGDDRRTFVVQKHDASSLHYDFRLELDGVLLSWAVPKGPSLDPSEKRLALRTEDHPVDYAGFEGVIPEDEYGGGTVMVWDRGTWRPDGDAHDSLDDGRLEFSLAGERLKGRWQLIRADLDDERESWLLMKRDDEHADAGTGITERETTSAASGRSMDEIGADGGDGDS